MWVSSIASLSRSSSSLAASPMRSRAHAIRFERVVVPEQAPHEVARADLDDHYEQLLASAHAIRSASVST